MNLANITKSSDNLEMGNRQILQYEMNKCEVTVCRTIHPL